jgi:hypothetical protein
MIHGKASKRFFCTFFDENFLTRGLALYESLTEWAKPFELMILCLDERCWEILNLLSLPGVRLIRLPELESAEPRLLIAKQNRSRIEYYFTCTPELPRFLLERFPEIDLITYLDADLFFYSDPQPIFSELEGGSILIVGHRFSERNRHLEQFGIYNVGLLSFRNDQAGRTCLDWWSDRCLEWCYDRVEAGRFADQKYLDDWPKRFERVRVLQHSGAGLAPWNLDGAALQWNGGQVLVNGQPLVFFHFHKLKILRSWLFRTGLDEFGAHLNSVSRRIYGGYINRLKTLHQRLGTTLHNSPRLGGQQSLRQIFQQMRKGRSLLSFGGKLVEIGTRPAVLVPSKHD